MPVWMPAAVSAAVKLAQTPAGRKFAGNAAGAAAGAAGKAGAGHIGRRRASRQQRELAHKLSRQVHGQLSKAVFIGSSEEHLVVWKDSVPIAAFPPVEGVLAGKSELAHVT